VLLRIFLNVWKENLIVNILCFISLLILCLKVEVIKRLLQPLNDPAASFKNGLIVTSLIAPRILELEKSLSNKMFVQTVN